MKRLWIAASAAVFVGAAFLLAWLLAREPLPAGAILIPRDAPTLAAALESAHPRDVIVLDARRGPFSGGVSIDIPDLRICSRNGSAVLQGGDPVLSVAADRVTIEDVTLEGAGVGIVVTGSGCRISGAVLRSFAASIRILGAGSLVEDSRLRGGRIGVEVLSSGATVRTLECSGLIEAAVRANGARACEITDVSVNSCAAGILCEDSSGVLVTGASVDRSDTGIVVLRGSSVAVRGCGVSSSKIGVQLRGTSDASVTDCRFDRLDDAGVSLEGTRRARVAENVFRACREGIRASGAGESALLDNTLLDSADRAIRLEGGDGDLVSGNNVRGGIVGISLERGSGAQVLRNRIERALRVGILLDRADEVQVLDAKVIDCATGIAAVATSGARILRCDVRSAAATGISCVNGTLGNLAAENHVSGAGQGVLLAGSSRDTLTNNIIARCGVGVALCRLGYGTRVEGNDLRECAVGLAWTDETWAPEAPLARLGFGIARASSAVAPLVINNAFAGSRVVDVRNNTEMPLLIGGNRWPDGTARIEGDVRVPDSGKTGTIALGSTQATSDVVLGRLVEWMLLEEGLPVVDLIGLGAEEKIERALAQGDLDAAWCSDDATPNSGGSFWRVPFERGWSLVTTAEIAKRAGKGSDAVTVAVPDGVALDLVAAALARHGLAARAIRAVSTGAEAESLLKFGTVDCAIVDRLDETVTLAGFVVLDDAAILPTEAIGLCVSDPGGAAGSVLRSVFDRLSARLSEEGLRNLVSRVRLLRRDPADVAMEYLLREGLIGGSAEGGSG